MNADYIIIEDLQIDTHIGVTKEERNTTTRLRVDLNASTSLENAAQKDAINDTIDYAVLREDVMNIIKNTRHHLLEALALQIINHVKTTFNAKSVEIKLCKLNLFDDTKAVGIRMQR